MKPGAPGPSPSSFLLPLGKGRLGPPSTCSSRPPHHPLGFSHRQPYSHPSKPAASLQESPLVAMCLPVTFPCACLCPHLFLMTSFCLNYFLTGLISQLHCELLGLGSNANFFRGLGHNWAHPRSSGLFHPPSSDCVTEGMAVLSQGHDQTSCLPEGPRAAPRFLCPGPHWEFASSPL